MVNIYNMGLRKFLANGTPSPPVRKFAGRYRSDLKKFDFVRVFGFRKFLADGTPPLLGNLLGGPDLTSKKFQKFSANGTPPVSVYARFRAFGPGKQHKYHLYASS